jgi:hypothetical protein
MKQLLGEELVKKMWETLADKGIGSLLKPWQIRRVGRAITDAQIDAKLRIAQAERDEEAIRAGKVTLEGNSTLRLIYNAQSDKSLEMMDTLITQNISMNLIAEATRKEVKTAKAILHAEESAMENKETISEEAVNPDWLFRWRDSAADVSNKELQILWGKILAGEVKAPGTFSLRTVDFLKNISKEEAEEIAKLAPYIISGSIWRTDDLEQKGLPYGYMLRMQELGILNGIEAANLTQTISSVNSSHFIAHLIGTDRLLVVQHDDPKKTITLSCYRLTTVGAEIMKLCSATSDKDYLRSLGITLAKDGFKVLMATYHYNGKQGISWWKEEEITLPETSPA